MAAYPLSTRPTAHGVVTIHITLSQAGWAGTRVVENWQSQSIFEGNDKFWRTKVQSQGLKRGGVEPIASVVKGEGQQPRL